MSKELPVVNVQLNYRISDCRECPKVKSVRTEGAGYAFDYHCTNTANNKMIMGYVEYESDIQPVPNWCPSRTD